MLCCTALLLLVIGYALSSGPWMMWYCPDCFQYFAAQLVAIAAMSLVMVWACSSVCLRAGQVDMLWMRGSCIWNLVLVRVWQASAGKAEDKNFPGNRDKLEKLESER